MYGIGNGAKIRVLDTDIADISGFQTLCLEGEPVYLHLIGNVGWDNPYVDYSSTAYETSYDEYYGKKVLIISFTMPAEPVTLGISAEKIPSYTITYNLDEGTVAEENPTEYDVLIQDITLNQPTKEGYVFLGWTGSNGTTPQKQVTIQKGTTGNLTYTANWIKEDIQYIVEHYKQNIDGTYPETATDRILIDAKIGDTVTPETKTYEGFTSPEVQPVELTEDGQVIRYDYERNSYTVWINHLGNGVKEQEDKTYKYGEQVIIHLEVIEGYQLLNVYPSAAEVEIQWMDEDVRFTMPARGFGIETQSEPITYSIIYNLDDGTHSENPSTYTVEAEDIILNQPTKEGYVFLGWTGSNGTTPQTEVTIPKGTTGDLTYTANWEKIYTIEIIATVDGSIDRPLGVVRECKEGEAVQLQIFAATGWSNLQIANELTFTHNTSEENGVLLISFMMPAEDVRIEVGAEPIQYTITYNLDGGTAEGNPTTYTVEDTITLNKPTREGYVFEGWRNDQGWKLGKEYTIQAGTTGDLSFTATWTQVDTAIQYIVEHYKQNIDGTYPTTATDSKTIEAKIGDTVTPEVKTYEGFTSPKVRTVELTEDGQVIRYDYQRNSYNVEITKGEGIELISGNGTYKYEEEVTLSAEAKKGYGNIKWTGDKTSNTFYMPSNNVQISVSASLIEYEIKYNLNGGNVEGNEGNLLKYTIETEEFALKNPTRVGYTFIGWTGSNGTTPQKQVTIPKGTTGNLEYTANWEVISTDEPDDLEIEISYSTKQLTNQNVTVIISANNKIKATEGWNLSEDGKSISKVYKQNATETVTIIDEYDNQKPQTVVINNIDKISPEIIIGYIQQDNYVTVIATSNEELKEIEDWEISHNKKEMRKAYYVNKEEEVSFFDLAGNETKKTIKINSINNNDDEPDEGDPNEGNPNDPDDDDKGTIDSIVGDKIDSTTSNKELPKAGMNFAMGTGLIIIAICVILFIKVKKYKDIK